MQEVISPKKVDEDFFFVHTILIITYLPLRTSLQIQECTLVHISRILSYNDENVLSYTK